MMMMQQNFTEICRSLWNETAIDYRRTSRALRKTESPASLHVALMGNMTLDLVTPYFMVEAAKVGHMAAFHVSPFGQYVQDLHSDALEAFHPDVIVLALCPESMRPDGFQRFHLMSVADRIALRDDIVAEIEGWIVTAEAKSAAALMIGNFPGWRSSLGLADLASDYGEQEFFLDLNLALMRMVRAHPRAQILDLASAALRVGTRQAFDARLHHLAKLSWTDAMMREAAQLFAHAVVGALGLARKCLVLDLDNTLWGGVLGEDGPHGVRVGAGDMMGEAYHAFQMRVRALKDRGILLALCSKNNPEDVEELFRLRTDMPLKFSDFSASAIGWHSKHEGLEQLARTLNIGLDALVFMDDNPAEIAAVRANCPDVHCVLLPAEPADYVAVLDELPWFEKSRLTAEDRTKTEHYALAVRRESFRAHRDPKEYLRDLQMRAIIRDAEPADLLRIHQLFGKTNQFNLTTRRPSMGEVEGMLADDRVQLIVAQLRDRFGDLGTVAVCVLRDRGGEMEVEDLLMSCRAMGRGLENAVMNDIKRRFLACPGAGLLKASYIATAKNSPVRTYCSDQGFAATEAEDRLVYQLHRDEVRFVECDWIALENEA